jgi:hypothetical protein
MKVITKVNDIDIVVIEEKKLVPIKPICDALCVDHIDQMRAINNDDILRESVVIDETTKDICLPLKYALGWVFIIEDEKVLNEHKMQCYNSIYNYTQAVYSF